MGNCFFPPNSFWIMFQKRLNECSNKPNSIKILALVLLIATHWKQMLSGGVWVLVQPSFYLGIGHLNNGPCDFVPMSSLFTTFFFFSLEEGTRGYVYWASLIYKLDDLLDYNNPKQSWHATPAPLSHTSGHKYIRMDLLAAAVFLISNVTAKPTPSFLCQSLRACKWAHFSRLCETGQKLMSPWHLSC